MPLLKFHRQWQCKLDMNIEIMKINVENNILQGLQKTITEVSQQLAFYQIDKLRNEYRIHIAIHFYTQGVWPTFYQHLLL